MSTEKLLVRARRAAGLRQDELAARARTSRPTLSAYEHGRKSPTLETAARLLEAAGFELSIQPRVSFVERRTARGRAVRVPSALPPRLPVEEALATIELPLHLNWSQPHRQFDLSDRRDRARVYEIVLREGGPDDVLVYIDGALLADLWDELVLPRDIRAAWADVMGQRPSVAAS
ncbi:MAG: helix-turn-helix domain-containing protein [Pseudonocardiaceae bacterium]